jgi:hypothetical protein
MNRDDFDSYENLSEYWLKEDALRSLDYDVYFSLGTRYYCDAGCKVCYIKDNLEKTKNLPNYQDDIESREAEWFKFFEYFGVVRTNDDMYYLKHNYPKHYEWYLKHGSTFELCITDNAIFRTLQLEELPLKRIGDITVSTDFVKQVGVEKVLTAVKELYDRYGVEKVKYIDCGHPELIMPILEWANKLGLHNCVHHDFRTKHREILNHAWAEYQNTWVTNDDQGLIQVYRESVHLYYDRFYFSSDDASNIFEHEFYLYENEINTKVFLVNLITGKQKRYWENRNRPIEKKFRDYYKVTQEFEVNEDFNFIPNVMFPSTARFFYRMEEDGWKRTQYGLYLPSQNSEIKSLIQPRKYYELR